MSSHWTYVWGRDSLSLSVYLSCLCLWDIPLQVFPICGLIDHLRYWLCQCIKTNRDFLSGLAPDYGRQLIPRTEARSGASCSLLWILSDRPARWLNCIYCIYCSLALAFKNGDTMLWKPEMWDSWKDAVSSQSQSCGVREPWEDFVG